MHVELLMEQATYAVQQDGHQDIHEEYSDRGINAAPIYEASEPGTYSESSLRSRSRSRDPPSDLASEYYRPMPSVSPLLNTDPTTYEVRDLPGLSTSSSADGQVSLRRHWSGHIPLLFAGQESYGSAFFWLFEPDLSARDQPLKEEEDDASLPLIIWLNGGPGNCDPYGSKHEQTEKALTSCVYIYLYICRLFKHGWLIPGERTVAGDRRRSRARCAIYSYYVNHNPYQVEPLNDLSSMHLLYVCYCATPSRRERSGRGSGRPSACSGQPSLVALGRLPALRRPAVRVGLCDRLCGL